MQLFRFWARLAARKLGPGKSPRGVFFPTLRWVAVPSGGSQRGAAGHQAGSSPAADGTGTPSASPTGTTLPADERARPFHQPLCAVRLRVAGPASAGRMPLTDSAASPNHANRASAKNFSARRRTASVSFLSATKRATASGDRAAHSCNKVGANLDVEGVLFRRDNAKNSSAARRSPPARWYTISDVSTVMGHRCRAAKIEGFSAPVLARTSASRTRWVSAFSAEIWAARLARKASMAAHGKALDRKGFFVARRSWSLPEMPTARQHGGARSVHTAISTPVMYECSPLHPGRKAPGTGPPWRAFCRQSPCYLRRNTRRAQACECQKNRHPSMFQVPPGRFCARFVKWPAP